jgi:hypothetical protein
MNKCVILRIFLFFYSGFAIFYPLIRIFWEWYDKKVLFLSPSLFLMFVAGMFALRLAVHSKSWEK